MKTAFLPTLALVAVALVPAQADEDVPALSAWGKYSQIKKTDFVTFSYVVRKKGKKPKKTKVLVQVSDSVEFYRDVKVGLNGFKVGQEVWLLGTPDKTVTQSPQGGSTTDYQIQNTAALVAGDGLNLTEGKQVGKLKWLKATVSRAGGGLAVKFEGQDHKVRCAKRWAAMIRVKLEKRPKKFKKGLIEVMGSKMEKPADLKAKQKEAFAASRVVVLDKRLKKALYPLLLN